MKGESCVGGFVGAADKINKLEGCASTGNIIGNECVSGGIGYLKSGSDNTFANCHHKGTINNAGDCTGGIVGKSDGGCIAGMESSSHFGDIIGNNYVGGVIGAIIGIKSNTPILNTYRVYETWGGPYDKNWHSTNLILKDTIIDGEAQSSFICNCFASGNIKANDFVGGLLGYEACSVEFDANSTLFTNSGYGYKYYINE